MNEKQKPAGGTFAVPQESETTDAKGALTDMIKEIATTMAVENKIAMEDAMARVKGVVTRRPKPPSSWPKESIPDKVDPGYCVITDRAGTKYRKVECYHVMAASKGGYVNTLEGMRGPATIGALYEQVTSGQMIVVQLTPYDKVRDDGVQTLPKGGAYPVSPQDFTKWQGTYYHNIFGRDFLERAKNANNTEAVNA